MSNSSKTDFKPCLSERRRAVILELLDHARGLAEDEDEPEMAAHIGAAIAACRQDHAHGGRFDGASEVRISKA